MKAEILAIRVVERKRPVTVLAVHTGDPSHKVRITRLSRFCAQYSIFTTDHSYLFESE